MYVQIQEFILIPYKYGYIRIDIFEMTHCYEAHARSVYGGFVVREKEKNVCILNCLKKIDDLKPPQEE